MFQGSVIFTLKRNFCDNGFNCKSQIMHACLRYQLLTVANYCKLKEIGNKF